MPKNHHYHHKGKRTYRPKLVPKYMVHCTYCTWKGNAWAYAGYLCPHCKNPTELIEEAFYRAPKKGQV